MLGVLQKCGRIEVHLLVQVCVCVCAVAFWVFMGTFFRENVCVCSVLLEGSENGLLCCGASLNVPLCNKVMFHVSLHWTLQHPGTTCDAENTDVTNFADDK